jgi:outer membrane protein TolC
MMRCAALLCLLAGGLAGCASGTKEPLAQFPPAPSFPPEHLYSLDDLIQLAIHHNAGLDVARYEAEAAGGLVDQVKALWLPSLRYNFAVTAYDNDLNYKANAFNIVSLDVPITGSYNIINSATLSQILTTGGKRTSGLKLARMFAAIKRLEVLRQQDAVAQDVATYYQLVCLTNEIDAILEDAVRRIRVFRQVAGGLNARGSLRASNLDFLQADFLASQIDQLRFAVQSGRHQAYAALRQAVGLPRDAPLRLRSATLPPPVRARELFSAYARIVQGFFARPEIRMVDLFARLRAEQVEFAKAAYLPNVVFAGSAAFTGGSNNNILSAISGLIAGVIVDVPIYDPVRRGRLREALGLEHASEAFRRQIEELITLEIEVTAVDCQRALVTLLEAQRAARLAAEHYDAARQAYTRELVPASDVIAALAIDVAARIQQRYATFAYLNASSKLKRVTADRETPYGY